jgi:hypothetical protein
MLGPRRARRRRLGLLIVLATVGAGGALWLGWEGLEPAARSHGGLAGPQAAGLQGEGLRPPGPEPAPLPPCTGWEEAAETIVADLQAILDGRPRSGAFVEASTSAARADLARYPPGREQLRRMLLGSDRERVLALAALSSGSNADDDLLGLALRSRRDGDGAVMRLLTAEWVASLPPPQLSRHEEELLAAFVGEQNPLVLALALPALERLEEGRLRTLLQAQIASAPDPMLPVLVGLARDRLGPEALADVGILVGPAAPGR